MVVLKLDTSGARAGGFGTQRRGLHQLQLAPTRREDLVLLPDGRLVGGRHVRRRRPTSPSRALRPTARSTPRSTVPAGSRSTSGGTDVLTGACRCSPTGALVLAGYTSAGGGIAQNIAVARLTTQRARGHDVRPGGTRHRSTSASTSSSVTWRCRPTGASSSRGARATTKTCAPCGSSADRRRRSRSSSPTTAITTTATTPFLALAGHGRRRQRR